MRWERKREREAERKGERSEEMEINHSASTTKRPSTISPKPEDEKNETMNTTQPPPPPPFFPILLSLFLNPISRQTHSFSLRFILLAHLSSPFLFFCPSARARSDPLKCLQRGSRRGGEGGGLRDEEGGEMGDESREKEWGWG